MLPLLLPLFPEISRKRPKYGNKIRGYDRKSSCLFRVARQPGFEPGTYGLEGRNHRFCSYLATPIISIRTLKRNDLRVFQAFHSLPLIRQFQCSLSKLAEKLAENPVFRVCQFCPILGRIWQRTILRLFWPLLIAFEVLEASRA